MENKKESMTGTNTANDYGKSGGTSTKMAPDTSSQTDKSSNGELRAAPVGNVTEKAKETAGSLVDQAKATAVDAYDAVADKASSVIAEQKTEFTGGLAGVADTVRRISGAINDGESKNGVAGYAAQYAETAARKLEGAANYFEQNDLKAMTRDAESYARRNPAIFLGAAFVLGVVAARFIRSSPHSEAMVTGTDRQIGGTQNRNAQSFEQASSSL